MLPVDEIRLNFNPASLVALNVVLGFLMFGIALDTRVADFRRVLRMPGAMAVGVAAQFIVLPAVTFVLTLLLKPGPSIALGMILVACCPPGNVSSILTHRAGGNVALSVSMTAISNALAIVLMPLNFAFWGGLHPTAAPLLRSIALDPLEMAGHIVVIIGLPFALGILCAEKLPRFTQRVTKPVRILSFVCLIGFVVGAVRDLGTLATLALGVKALAACPVKTEKRGQAVNAYWPIAFAVVGAAQLLVECFDFAAYFAGSLYVPIFGGKRLRSDWMVWLGCCWQICSF